MENSNIQHDCKKQHLEEPHGQKSDGEAKLRDKTKRWSKREESALTKAFIQYGRNNWEKYCRKFQIRPSVNASIELSFLSVKINLQDQHVSPRKRGQLMNLTVY